MISHSQEVITPEIAKSYLAKNISNRTLKMRVVEQISRDIQSGNFSTTHQGIAFDTNGNLIDGQHRLWACITANTPITIDVARNVPDDARENIDTGVSRSFADAIKIMGQYEDNPVFRSSAIISTVRSIVYCGLSKRFRISNAEMGQIFEALSKELNIIYRSCVNRGNNSSQRTNSPERAAALAALLCGESEEDIFNFFSAYSMGDVDKCAGKNYSIALNWRNQIMDARARRAAFEKLKIYLGTQNAIWNYCKATAAKRQNVPKEPRYPVKGILVKILKVDSEVE